MRDCKDLRMLWEVWKKFRMLVGDSEKLENPERMEDS